MEICHTVIHFTATRDMSLMFVSNDHDMWKCAFGNYFIGLEGRLEITIFSSYVRQRGRAQRETQTQTDKDTQSNIHTYRKK